MSHDDSHEQTGGGEKFPEAPPNGGAKPKAGKRKAAKSKSNGASKPRAQKAKHPDEPIEPLPDEAQPAPELPSAKRIETDYPHAGDDIFADISDDDDLSDEAPSIPKLVDKLPKSVYVRFRPGEENRTALNTIKLDEADQRPGEINVYVLTREMRDYFINHLGYKVTKMMVIDAISLQGDQFMFMFPATSQLSGNSWATSRNRMIDAGMKDWIIIRTDLKAHEYKWRIRKAHLPVVDFRWPTEPIKDRARKAIDGPRLVSSPGHPIVKRLEGETDVDNGED